MSDNQEPLSDWEKEQLFWKENPVARFDIEEMGCGYESYRDMAPSPEYGDWIRAEDHRRIVESLLARLNGL